VGDFCELNGLVQPPVNATPDVIANNITVLPAGFRPPRRVIGTTLTAHGEVTGFAVHHNGIVQLFGAFPREQIGWISFNIVYRILP